MRKKILDEKIVELFPKFSKKEEYLEVALDILGYSEKKKLPLEEKIKFLESIGLDVPKNENIENRDIHEYLYSILACDNKDGRNCFEHLAEQGKFDILNKNKKIPEILVFNGMTQPIFDYRECIFEKVYVEVPLDTDLDGKRDLIAVYIRRPKETLIGMKVPAIYIANPYMMTCIDKWYENMPNVDVDIKEFKEENIKEEDIKYKGRRRSVPNERESNDFITISETDEISLDCITDWYNYFNSRGFASVYSGGLGTKGSEGLNCCGSEEEKIWVISVIEWLCGKRKAYTNKTDNIEIKASWCNGKVAMSGKSYLGTLSIAAASTGIEGLKTIIPEAAISSWYNYYHGNGLNQAPVGWQGDDADLLTGYCRSRDMKENPNLEKIGEDIISYLRNGMDRENGNYNKFWDERNYLKDIKNMTASAFIVHGINDWNVKTSHCHLFWKELEKYNIPKKMILHQGDHIYIHDLKGIKFNEIMNKWLSYWLYDIDNDVMSDVPEVFIQDNIDIAKWHNNYEGEDKKFFIDENGNLNTFGNKSTKEIILQDDVDSTKFKREDKNSVFEWQKDIILEENTEKKYRKVYLTEPLKEDMRISGAAKIKLVASCDRPTGILTGMLVDIGDEKRFTTEQFISKEKAIHLGKNAGTMDEKDFVQEKESSPFKIITRGSINIQNRENNYCKKSVEIGKNYTYQWELVPTDYNIKKGHKLELIILGSDVEITYRQKRVTNFKIKESTIDVEIPIIK